jgi:hypothetical protein
MYILTRTKEFAGDNLNLYHECLRSFAKCALAQEGLKRIQVVESELEAIAFDLTRRCPDASLLGLQMVFDVVLSSSCSIHKFPRIWTAIAQIYSSCGLVSYTWICELIKWTNKLCRTSWNPLCSDELFGFEFHRRCRTALEDNASVCPEYFEILKALVRFPNGMGRVIEIIVGNKWICSEIEVLRLSVFELIICDMKVFSEELSSRSSLKHEILRLFLEDATTSIKVRFFNDCRNPQKLFDEMLSILQDEEVLTMSLWLRLSLQRSSNLEAYAIEIQPYFIKFLMFAHGRCFWASERALFDLCLDFQVLLENSLLQIFQLYVSKTKISEQNLELSRAALFRYLLEGNSTKMYGLLHCIRSCLENSILEESCLTAVLNSYVLPYLSSAGFFHFKIKYETMTSLATVFHVVEFVSTNLVALNRWYGQLLHSLICLLGLILSR